MTTTIIHIGGALTELRKMAADVGGKVHGRWVA